jgi:hypothetical protein
MLDTASGAGALLGDSRAAEVREFYRGVLAPGGGFTDRAGSSDLYYTVFGIQGCLALGEEIPTLALQSYLESFGLCERLDMVHISCIARCWAMLGLPPRPAGLAAALLARVEACRAADGGYAQQPGCLTGSTYGCFLALGAYQDLGADLPDPARATRSLSNLAVGDGSYANDAMMPIGSVPATAAAVMVLSHLGNRESASAEWLLAQHGPAGGFRAIPMAPEPDLLSTAVALQALRKLGTDVSAIARPCLGFVNSLYSAGRFGGYANDPSPDAEYTFYGLLSLGCLGQFLPAR